MCSLARPTSCAVLLCFLAACSSLDEGSGRAEDLRRAPGLPGLPGDVFDPCPGGRCPDGGPPPDPDGGTPFFEQGGIEEVVAEPTLVVRPAYRDRRSPRAPIGPAPMQIENVRAGETIEAVLLAGGAPRPRLHVGLPGGERLVSSGGTAGAPLWRADRAYALVRLRVSAAPGTASGTVRLVRNDAAVVGHDADGDLLGAELEAHLGLCSRRAQVARGFDCRRATDLRDTDGDGIRDDWEVVGRRDATPHQPLALWGADPRPFGGSSFPGRAYLLYQDSVGNPRMAITHADGIGPSATRRLGLDSPLDNVWMTAWGGDLLFEPGFDTALRAVTVSASGDPAKANRITLRPNADGTTVQLHEDVSDLRVMSITLCRTLMRPTDAIGGPVDSAIADPLTCPDWDYPWFP